MGRCQRARGADVQDRALRREGVDDPQTHVPASIFIRMKESGSSVFLADTGTRWPCAGRVLAVEHRPSLLNFNEFLKFVNLRLVALLTFSIQ